jgi:hypothetical protein
VAHPRLVCDLGLRVHQAPARELGEHAYGTPAACPAGRVDDVQCLWSNNASSAPVLHGCSPLPPGVWHKPPGALDTKPGAIYLVYVSVESHRLLLSVEEAAESLGISRAAMYLILAFAINLDGMRLDVSGS